MKPPFTKASLRRAIIAARSAGMRISAIRPDGTLILREPDDIVNTRNDDVFRALHAKSKFSDVWEDVEA